MLAPDTTLHGRYRIVYAVDERPESQIYRARDEQTGKLVLLGLFAFGSDAERQQLEQGATQITALRHEMIFPLIEHFAEGASYCLVCEDGGGQDLERSLRAIAGPLPEGETLVQATKLLEALEMLQSKNPPVYLGEPLPTDLWIIEQYAWRFAPFTLLRQIGHGSSPYVAPELLQPDAEPTSASDTYAVSALLYHALTGWAPPSPLQRQAGTPVNPPRALNPNISALTEQALLRGLQDKPGNRYQNAREMRLALETVKMMAGRTLGPDAMPVSTLPSSETLPGNYTPAPPAALPTAQPPAMPAPLQYPPPYQPPYPAQPGAPAPAGYAAPPYAAVYAQPAPKKRGIGTGCLVALAVLLTLLAILIAGMLAFLFFTSAGRSMLNGGVTTLATAVPAESQPAPANSAPPSTAVPSGAATTLGLQAITLQNAAQITHTLEITSEVAGPIAYSPDGKSLAIGVSKTVTIRPADLKGTGVDLKGHDGLVLAVVWSPDSRMVASGAIDDKTIRLWDAATGKLIRELNGHEGWIRSLAWSPDGKSLASGATDETVRIWDVDSGKPLQILNGHTGWIGGVAWSPDSKRLASASRDGTVRLWDAASGQPIEGFTFAMPLDPSTGQRLWTTGVAFSNDGKLLAVGSTDTNARLLDAATGKEERLLQGHTGWIVIRGVAFTPDNTQLLTASLDGTIRSWDVATGKETGRYDGHQLGINGIALSPDGQQLASTSSEDGGIYLWDVAEHKALAVLRIGQGLVMALSYAPDASAVGTVGTNGTVQLYNMAQQRGRLLSGSIATEQPMAFVKKDQLALITDQGDILLFVSGQQNGTTLTGMDGTPVVVVASPDGSLIAGGSSTGAVSIWDNGTEKAQQTLHGDLKRVNALAINDDGTLLAVAGSTAPADEPDVPRVEIWDLKTGKLKQTLSDTPDRVGSLAFQPHGTLLATTDRGGAVRIWQTQTGSLVRAIEATPEEQRYTSIAFSPDGVMLVGAALSGELLFWDSGSGDEAARVMIPEGSPIALAFSPDGKQLAVSVRNETGSVFVYRIPSA